MKGILFKEDLFNSVIQELKTETRRIAITEKPKYKAGEKVFLKEPYIHWGGKTYYKFDQSNEATFNIHAHCLEEEVGWKNKLFMPEKYARYYIEITGVIGEKLQDISEQSAIAEGVERDRDGWKSYDKIYVGPHKGKDHPFNAVPYRSAFFSFKSLWERINGEEQWESNPKVWAYKFKLVK